MPGRWRVDTPAGNSVEWDGFFTGPVVLSDDEISKLCLRLLGINVAELSYFVEQSIYSYRDKSTKECGSMYIHSATQTTKGFEGDLAELIAGRAAHDCATYLEARAVYLAGENDVVVGRTQAFLDAVNTLGVEFIDGIYLKYYYMSHALLVLANESMDSGSKLKYPDPLKKIMERISQRPKTIIRLYSLDIEMQIFLLWLKKEVGVDCLFVDANNPYVTRDWNKKTPLHPEVKMVVGLDVAQYQNDKEKLLLFEHQLSGYYQKLGLQIPTFPGYLISRKDSSVEIFSDDMVKAADLLRSRYKLSLGCLKPSEAGDGARIVLGVDLNDKNIIKKLAKEAFGYEDDYILEAYVKISGFEVGGMKVTHVPSGHIRNGYLSNGLTIQLMNGMSWIGNAYFDEQDCESMGMDKSHYRFIRSTLENIVSGFDTKKSEHIHCRAGLVTGGIDFMLGKIDGDFGEKEMVGVSDFNFSSHGAEFMRAYMKKIETHQQKKRVATKVFRPTRQATFASILRCLGKIRDKYPNADIIANIPGRWGMIANTGSTPIEAIENVLLLENYLQQSGFVWSEK